MTDTVARESTTEQKPHYENEPDTFPNALPAGECLPPDNDSAARRSNSRDLLRCFDRESALHVRSLNQLENQWAPLRTYLVAIAVSRVTFSSSLAHLLRCNSVDAARAPE